MTALSAGEPSLRAGPCRLHRPRTLRWQRHGQLFLSTRSIFPEYTFNLIRNRDEKPRFEALSRDGGNPYCLLSEDAREIWRELRGKVDRRSRGSTQAVGWWVPWIRLCTSGRRGEEEIAMKNAWKRLVVANLSIVATAGSRQPKRTDYQFWRRLTSQRTCRRFD